MSSCLAKKSKLPSAAEQNKSVSVLEVMIASRERAKEDFLASFQQNVTF